MLEARFDHNKNNRRCCEEGTRVEILKIIYDWLGFGKSQSERTTKDYLEENERMVWIRGLAGSGKSTLAQTTAYKCIEEKIHLATFFCSRYSAELSDYLNIFLTICYQLCQFDETFRREVSRIIEEDKDIQHSEVERQLQKLIIGPLKAARHFPPCVVIIDALDECTNSDTRAIILTLLGKYSAELKKLIIVVTSRPSHDINVAFKLLDVGNYEKLSLDNVDPLQTDHDLEIVLRKGLERIRQEYDLPTSWPAQEQIGDLVEQAQHLFIFISTAIEFVADSKSSNPERKLERLLNSQTFDTRSSPFAYLDNLYREVFIAAFPDIDEDLQLELQTVLKTLILGRELFSTYKLEQLMELKSGTVRRVLLRLHAVVVVPDNDEDDIRLIHPSIHDFLTDASRCTDGRFYMNKAAGHSHITRCCFQAITKFAESMEVRSVLQAPTRRKLKSLEESLYEKKHSAVKYSDRYWDDHFNASDLDDEVMVELESFITHQHKSLLISNPNNATYKAAYRLLDTIKKLPVSMLRK